MSQNGTLFGQTQHSHIPVDVVSCWHHRSPCESFYPHLDRNSDWSKRISFAAHMDVFKRSIPLLIGGCFTFYSINWIRFLTQYCEKRILPNFGCCSTEKSPIFQAKFFEFLAKISNRFFSRAPRKFIAENSLIKEQYFKGILFELKQNFV